MNMHVNMTATVAALLASGAVIERKDADPMDMVVREVKNLSTTVAQRLGKLEEGQQDLEKKSDENACFIFDLAQKTSRPRGDNLPETWGRQVAHSDEIKGIGSNWRGRLRMEVRATLTSSMADAAGSAGSLVAPTRPDGVIDLARRKLRIRALFSPGNTSSNAIEWPMMKSRTNNAAMVAEGQMKPQSDLQFELKQWPVRTLAHWMLASKQILDDAPALTSLIDSELRYGVAEVEDMQLLMGSGAGNDLIGVYPGAAAFSAPFTLPSPVTMIDVLLLAIAQCDTAGYETDGIVLHPLDWRKIQALKDTQGRYLGGGPFSDLVARLWLMPVVQSEAMTSGKFLVGAFRQGGQIFDREEAIVEISTEDSDNFRRNLVTLRGEERLAFVVKHADAFIKGDFAEAITDATAA